MSHSNIARQNFFDAKKVVMGVVPRGTVTQWRAAPTSDGDAFVTHAAAAAILAHTSIVDCHITFPSPQTVIHL